MNVSQQRLGVTETQTTHDAQLCDFFSLIFLVIQVTLKTAVKYSIFCSQSPYNRMTVDHSMQLITACDLLLQEKIQEPSIFYFQEGTQCGVMSLATVVSSPTFSTTVIDYSKFLSLSHTHTHTQCNAMTLWENIMK